MKNLFLML